MEDPNNKSKNTIIDVILILLIIALAFVLYTFVESHWMKFDPSGDLGPFGRIVESVSAFGRGLQGMFSRILR